jgi:hypothetical protein
LHAGWRGDEHGHTGGSARQADRHRGEVIARRMLLKDKP